MVKGPTCQHSLLAVATRGDGLATPSQIEGGSGPDADSIDSLLMHLKLHRRRPGTSTNFSQSYAANEPHSGAEQSLHSV